MDIVSESRHIKSCPKEEIHAILNQELTKIKPTDKRLFCECKENWNKIAKPLNGLGELEEIICKIGAIRNDISVPVQHKCSVIFCADNGVICEGVSQTDEAVTVLVSENLAKGIANVNIIGKISNTKVFSVDVGMKADAGHKDVIDFKIRRGTDNIAKGPAMKREECVRAIVSGIVMAGYVKELGYDIIASGEMGIGNTTTSSAIASLLLDEPAENVTGKGAGLSDEGLAKKIAVIKKALQINAPDKYDAIDIISKMGGLDIAAMTGLFLGGGVYGIPVVIDGLISSVSAILAAMLKPEVKDYMLASHYGKEPACRRLLDILGLRAVICANLALGEGTGAVCAFPLIDIAHNVYSQNITFEDINMEAYKPL